MRTDALQNDDRLAVSVDEGCRLSGIRRTKFYQLINEGKIRTTKVGARRLVVLDSLRDLLAENAA